VPGESFKAVYDVAASHIDRELRSNEAIGSRAVALLGFCGVILALAANLAGNGFSDQLGTVGRPLAITSLVASFVAILIAAGFAVRILSPKPRGRVDPRVLRELRDEADAEEDVFERLSRSAIRLYKEEGISNDDRAEHLRWAYRALALGLLLVTVQAVTVALSSSKEPCATQKKTQTIHRTPTTKGHPMMVVTTSSTACARPTQVKTRAANAP
jgi:hypothetical protein